MSDKLFGEGIIKDNAQRSANVRKKLSLSPLPAQVDRYQIEEKVEPRWDRILPVGVLALALIWAAWSMLRPNAEPSATELMPQLGQQPEAAGSTTRIVPEVKEPANGAGQDEQLTEVINQLPAPSAIPSSPVDVSIPSPQAKAEPIVPNLIDAVKAALSIHDSHVASGYLHSVGSTFDIQPKDAGMRVALPKQGILKMELHAQLKSAQDQVLYHQWLRNGKSQAKISVEVKTPVHDTFSSKYINQQMSGEWQARVLDASGKVLAQADFTVY